MIKRTLGEVKGELRRVAGQAGLRVDDPRLVEYINIAQERLLPMGDWPFAVDRLKFRQYSGTLALPFDYQAAIRVNIDHVAGGVVHDKWFEFLASGPGPQDCRGWVDGAIDRGEWPVVQQPRTSEKMKVRLYSPEDERINGVRPTVRVFGLDEFGNEVRSEKNGIWSDGIDLELRGDDLLNYTTSEVHFSRITKVLLPRRRAYCEIHYVGEDATVYFAGRYHHAQRNAAFRIYQLPTVKDGETPVIRALCRRRFVPAIDDTDDLLITSLPALRKALIGLAREDAGLIAEAEMLFQSAANVLKDESKEHNTGVQPPVDVVSHTTSFGDIPDVI